MKHLIEKYKGDWVEISKHQNLSESFINKYVETIRCKKVEVLT